MQTALTRIAAQLPAGVDPQVLAGSTDDFPVVVLAASGGGDQRARGQAARIVVPELPAIDGVREADASPAPASSHGDHAEPGQAGRRRAVATRPCRPRCGPTAWPMPAGTLTEGGKSLSVQVGTPIATLDDLAGHLPDRRPGARPPVRLGEVATVSSQLADAPRSPGPTASRAWASSVTATPDGNAVGDLPRGQEQLPSSRPTSAATPR